MYSCEWHKPDLDTLVKLFPTDYRPYLFRGLSHAFYARLEHKYSQPAVADFTRSAALSPRSALAYYFMGGLYSRDASFFSLLSDEEKAESRKKAFAAYDKAIQLDPKLARAYYERASQYYESKQHRLAIKDFDKAIELDPRRAEAFYDRALAKLELNDVYGAINDLSEALRHPDKTDMGIAITHDTRGDAYVKVGNFEAAIRDYTERISQLFSAFVFGMDLAQIRRLYPEYNALSDELLCRKLHAMFMPNMKYQDFKNQLTEKNVERGGLKDFVLPEVYVKRGDAYLNSGNFRKAIIEYQRAANGFPEYTVDRWHLIFKTVDADIYLDGQTVDDSSSAGPKFWIKTVDTSSKDHSGGYTLLNESIDCRSKSIDGLSQHRYNSQGNLLASDQVQSGWQPVVPDSLGERLYGGMCR